MQPRSMVVAPAFTREETPSLAAIKASAPGIAIGLHVTLTAPFRSLTGKAKHSSLSADACAATMLRASTPKALRARYAHRSRHFRTCSAPRPISSTVISMCSYSRKSAMPW